MEWKCLQDLKNDKSIVIKEADKGGSIVIMTSNHYKRMVHHHLDDKSTYKPVSNGIDDTIMKGLHSLTKKYSNILHIKEQKYITDFKSKPSLFYGLPKVHKSKIISDNVQTQNTDIISILEPEDLTLRPIIAGQTCPTKFLSKFVDILLRPFLTHIKSYIRDDLDFLNKCKRNTNTNKILCTFDVVSLYTNIPIDLGMEAIRYWLSTYPEKLHPRFTKEFILEALKFVLIKNSFKFNNQYYLQIRGTAMGTIVAPTYANLVVGFLEIKLYTIIEVKYGPDKRLEFEEEWFRFLDDCEILLDQLNLMSATELLQILNELNEFVKFTMECHNFKISFLDILINQCDNNVWLDIFFKSTDTRRCVPFNSCHPKKCLKNIPFTLAIRICTIVERERVKQIRLKELAVILKNQKYPTNLIISSFKRARAIPQSQLRQEKEKENNDVIAFVNTHNPNNCNVTNIINKCYRELQTDAVLKDVFNETRLVHAKKQPPNLKRILTRAEFNPKATIKFQVKRCGKPRCECCTNLMEGTEYKFKNYPTPFKVKSNFNCDSRNLIYVLICKKCREEYIGETGEGDTMIRDRVTVYRQHIKEPKYQKLKVEEHIRNCACGEFLIFPFFQLRSESKSIRKEYESYFQNKFKPRLN